MNNKYVNRSKISEAKFRELIRFFSLDLTAIQIADLTGLNRNTVNRYLTETRKKITRYSQATFPASISTTLLKENELHDSYAVLLKEINGSVYTEIVSLKKTEHLLNNEKNTKKVFSGFDLLINLEQEKHLYIGEKDPDPQRHRRKINRLESFWGSAKSRLAKFKGMHSSTFRYHMKECEFRYNHRNEDLYKLLLKILRNDPLF